MVPGRRRPVVGGLVAVVLLAVLGWVWLGSRLPSSYSALSMGYSDYGGAPPAAAGASGHAHGAGLSAAPLEAAGAGVRTVDVDDLVGDRTARPDVTVTLTARRERVRLPDGLALDGYTLNGSTPGPTVEAREGQLVEVRFRNGDVAEGATLHWHGLDVPNGEDGVAGITQDAVLPGQEHVYRFVARQVGTFWYHSHQVSHAQVVGGLFGALVVRPAVADGTAVVTGASDVVALLHAYEGHRTVNGREGDLPVPTARGAVVRVRLVNTDQGPTQAWVSGSAYRVLAVDGRDLHEPTEVRDTKVTVTAGGRVDLEVRVPGDGSGVRVQTPGSSLVVGPPGSSAPTTGAPSRSLDLLDYGTPAPLGFDPAAATRHFEYAIGRRFGLLDGRPGLWWTINGHLFPDVPMFMVREGDVVVMRVSNDSGEVHPMHLHGHHAVVLSRDGRPSTGSPWFVDSLNVENGQSYEIAFVADNPGIWMDHCHNLPHASEGLMTHLMYEGVTSTHLVGDPVGNRPE